MVDHFDIFCDRQRFVIALFGGAYTSYIGVWTCQFLQLMLSVLSVRAHTVCSSRMSSLADESIRVLYSVAWNVDIIVDLQAIYDY